MTPQNSVNRLGNIGMNGHTVPFLNFNHNIEGGWGRPFQYRLLGASPPRLLIPQGDRLYTADKVGEGGIQHQVFQSIAMSGTDQLDTALGDGSRRLRFELGANLVNNDDFGHVVFHRLYHRRVLHGRRFHLHPAGMADGRVRDIAVASNLIGRIDDDNPLVYIVGQHPGHFPQHRCLAHAGTAQQHDALARLHQVFNYLYRAENGAAHTAGQTNNAPLAISDGGYAVQRPLNPGPVVITEAADA